MKHIKTRRKVEFGDFQTPLPLAISVCALIGNTGFKPSTIIEPTCGQGNFLRAALGIFPNARIVGYEYDPTYTSLAIGSVSRSPQATVYRSDFFLTDWDSELEQVEEPLLVLGNPPWVTNSVLGSMDGRNIPPKSNLDRLRGIDAITGKANFDISEWMIRENLRWFAHREGAIAVLCKTSVARRILSYAWSTGAPISSASIFRINADREFGASVDACLLYIRLTPESETNSCDVYDGLSSLSPSSRFGIKHSTLLSGLDSAAASRVADLYSNTQAGWRSGVKHDCRKVFELSMRNGELVNDLGETVGVESENIVFPLLKGSDLANQRYPHKYVLVPNRSTDESPCDLRVRAPLVWRYLEAHESLLNARGSVIYKNRPKFSVFGIGPYSFTPWKVAISGLYKNLRFSKIGPVDGKPVLLDDTCYFFPCDSEEECDLLFKVVTSPDATAFWSSLVFWDSKRPITAKLLNQLDLAKLSIQMGLQIPLAWSFQSRKRPATLETRRLF